MNEIMPDHGPSRLRRRTVIVVSTITVSIAVLATVGILVGNKHVGSDAAPSEFPMIELIEKTLPPGLELVGPEDPQHLGDRMDHDVMQWQTGLQAAFFGNDNFGSPEISSDGKVFTLTWYGEPSDALRAQIASAPEGLEVVVRPADFPPGELQHLVVRAMRPGLVSGVQFAVGGVENDASGIHFGLTTEPEGKTLDEVGRTIGDALGRPDVPVRVEISGGVTPITG